MKMRWRVAAVIVCVAALSYCADNRPDLTLAEKPVIYLYPNRPRRSVSGWTMMGGLRTRFRPTGMDGR